MKFYLRKNILKLGSVIVLHCINFLCNDEYLLIAWFAVTKVEFQGCCESQVDPEAFKVVGNKSCIK